MNTAIHLTKRNLVVMDIEVHNRCEKMLKLREELLAVEEGTRRRRLLCK